MAELSVHSREEIQPRVSSSVGAGLFLCMFLFMWIGTSPYPDTGAVTGITAKAADSSSFNQLVTLFLTGSFLLYGLNSSMRSAIMQPRILMGLVFFWLFLTALLSAHPMIASKKVVLSVLTALNASIFLLLPQSERQMTRLLAIGSLITLAFAYFGVIFMPQRAIHQATDIIEPMLAGAWRGHYPHKNAAAASLVLMSFFGLYIRKRGLPKTGLLIVALCVYFVLHTGGKTSTAMLPFIVLMSLVFVRWKWTRVFIAIGGIAAFNIIAVGAAVFDPLRELVQSLGVDASFTNRSDIWKLAFAAISAKPIFGYGLDSFWKTPEMVYAGGGGASWAVAAFNAHNSFLDMMINAGVIGLALTLFWIMILPLRYIREAERTDNDPILTLLYIRLWLYGLYMSCMESTFFQNGGALWFCIMVAVFGLRLQAKARLETALGNWGNGGNG
ncbi:O-antigen ligase [Brucella pseudintermedia]|uniref:O-antigen ligase family protein n=1 Tax=Brucella pseudintermedia TaxID=370111 RepID=UPI003208C018